MKTKPPRLAPSIFIVAATLIGGVAQAVLVDIPGTLPTSKSGPPITSKIPAYAKVKYGGPYPGVDLVYYGNQRQFEFDFVVSPGHDPEQIALAFERADKVELDAQGNLVVTAAGGQLVQRKPLLYRAHRRDSPAKTISQLLDQTTA